MKVNQLNEIIKVFMKTNTNRFRIQKYYLLGIIFHFVRY